MVLLGLMVYMKEMEMLINLAYQETFIEKKIIFGFNILGIHSSCTKKTSFGLEL